MRRSLFATLPFIEFPSPRLSAGMLHFFFQPPLFIEVDPILGL
jgi:hypothetical protein